jgi:hypothetical protein
MAHTPSRLVNEHLGIGEDLISKIPKKEMIIAV